MHAKLREYDKALGQLELSLKLDPRDPEVFVEQGRIYEEKADLARAKAAYQAAIAAQPQSPTEREAQAFARSRLASIPR